MAKCPFVLVIQFLECSKYDIGERRVLMGYRAVQDERLGDSSTALAGVEWPPPPCEEGPAWSLKWLGA